MTTLSRFDNHPRSLVWFALLVSTLLAGCGGGGDGGRDPILGGGGTAVLEPQVVSVTPVNGALNVPVNTGVITASFNKAMDPQTITAASFTLACPAGTPVAGTVSYSTTNNVATLTLASNLRGSTACTATIAASVTDTAGNPLKGAHVWSFTTGQASETIAPTVSSTVPLLNATGVPVGRALTASFSEAMNPLTITASNFTLACPTGTAVTGSVSYAVNGNVATFTPSANLPFNTVCRATISTGVRDVAGNAMAVPFSWAFTTSATLDTMAPTVLSTLPRSNATGVPVNSLVAATFSEGMTPSTITASNFTVECPATAAITGSAAYAVNGNVATFTPGANLPGNTTCRATVKAGVKDLAGIALAADYTWNFTTGPVPDTTAPLVSSTVPTTNQTSVRTNTLVTASFSEPMNPLTITTANYSVACPAGTPVTGIVGYSVDGNVAMFSSVELLPASTTCRATITSDVEDVAGNAMAANYIWDFTTGVAPDTTAPRVTVTVPLSNEPGVAINTLVTARFSEPMDPFTITALGNYTVVCPLGSPVNGIVSYAVNSNVATFTPASTLPASTTCRASITTGVKDIAGNAMLSLYEWDFTTGVAPDTSPPTVTLRNPLSGALNVPLNKTVGATFSEEMDPLTITTANFTLMNGLVSVPGVVSYDLVSKIGSFNPNSDLLSGITYTATVTNDVTDLAGNNMTLDNTWDFSTGAALAPGAVDLGDAAGFGIMATSAITNTGPTMINGDVSLDPGSSNGLLPITNVNGTIHINDDVSAAARADLLEAYNFAKTLPPGVTIAPGADLGELYPTGIPPGTYTSDSTMLVATDLVLDAGGDPNAVWVFQIGSSLTTTTGSVLLSPAAQAKNAFWVSTEDATIGVGTTFNGTIISGRDSTAKTGAIVNGRIMTGATLAGTIALDSNTVNVPTP